MRINVRVTGIEEVRRKLGAQSADLLHNAIELDLANETRKMAVDAAKESPVETGALRASILSSPRREERLQYYWGSWLPYALRQEYEHKSKMGWMRGAWRVGKRELELTLVKTIKDRLS